MDLRIAPEPGDLPLGVLPGAELHQLLRLPPGHIALHRRHKLLVADGLHGGAAGGQSGGEQLPHLPLQSVGGHLVHPSVDARPQVRPVLEIEADGEGLIPGREGPGLPVVL